MTLTDARLIVLVLSLFFLCWAGTASALDRLDL